MWEKQTKIHFRNSQICCKRFRLSFKSKCFWCFYKSLKRKKILTYNRIFKDLSKEYDDGKLDYLKDVDTTDYIYKLVFQWLGNEYKEIIFENLSEERKE